MNKQIVLPHMQLLKSAIVTLLLVIAVLFGFMVFKFDTQYAFKLSEKEYEKRNYENALTTLQKIKKKTAKAELYKGYALRGLDKYKAAQNAFEKAFDKAETKELKNEASFNLLLTAYLQADFDFIRSHLSALSSKLPHVQFFSALCEYQAKNYDKAFQYFNEANPPQYYSAWMKETWQEEFPKLWEISHMAHCLIEMGKIDESRKLLEKHLESQEATNYTTYLLALGYLKEIPQKKTFEEALNAFELASTFAGHLSKESFSKLFNDQRFLDYALPMWSCLVEKGSLDAFDRWVHLQLYVNYFDAKHQTKILDQLSLNYKNLSSTQFFSKAPKLLALPWSERSLPQLEQMNLDFITELVQDENFESMNLHLPTIQRLLPTHLSHQDKISELIRTKLEHLIDEENTYSEIYNLLLLWDSVERNEENRMAFIKEVIPIVETLWSVDPKMALQLAKWVDQFSHSEQKEWVQNTMLDLLQEPSLQAHPKELLEANQYFNPLHPH